MEFLKTHWLELVLAIWPLLAFIAAVTPNEYDNKAVQMLRDLLDKLAMNFGHAKNKDSAS
ncbi:hypothetical protein [Ferrimonas balearica]|uniref:hypothetical protein n=1 Tax=Ferrimonas balearica TaxID=44012 RepID=UPI001F298EA5|nr:hypothetical protein [Ferrimonas balearica]MBY6093838.1 hypothetical protein [Ferrimonas balearica]